MARDALEIPDGRGHLQDRYGRNQFVLVEKHQAPLATDVQRGYEWSDPDGRQQMVLLDGNGESILADVDRRPLNVQAAIGAFAGAVGDGTTDDSDAFARAYATGRPLYAPTGTYLLTETPFVGDDPLNIFGDGPGRTIIDLEGVNLATISGSVATAVLLTASVALGATTLTMASTTGIAAGDDLIVRDTGQVLSGTTSSPYAGVVGEVVRVKSVDSGTVVTIWGAVEQAMTLTSGNLSARKVTPVDGCAVTGMTIRNPNPATYLGGDARALQFDYCRDLAVGSVHFVQLDDDAVNLESCVDWEVVSCKFDDLQNTGGRTPYGVVAVNASLNGLVHLCRQNGGRHLFTTGGNDGEIGPAHVLVSSCQAWHSTTNPFDTHPAGRHIVFANCQAHACLGGGFHLRSPKSRIVNPYVVGGAAAAGITLGGSAAGSSVSAGEVWGVTTAVDVQANDCDVERMKVEGSVYGVRVRDLIDLAGAALAKARVRDIHIVGNPSTGGVVFNGTDTATRVRDRIVAPDATTAISPGVPSVTAAATLTLPIGPQLVSVAGNTGITSITAAGHAGRSVTLKFEGTPTVTDGSNLKLAGNFVAAGTTADHDTLTLASDGTNWYELARSAN